MFDNRGSTVYAIYIIIAFCLYLYLFPVCVWIHLASCGCPDNVGEVHIQIPTS
jgi:hypothetical protein